MIRRCIIWRKRHAHDQALRELVKRANVAGRGTSSDRTGSSGTLSPLSPWAKISPPLHVLSSTKTAQLGADASSRSSAPTQLSRRLGGARVSAAMSPSTARSATFDRAGAVRHFSESDQAAIPRHAHPARRRSSPLSMAFLALPTPGSSAVVRALSDRSSIRCKFRWQPVRASSLGVCPTRSALFDHQYRQIDDLAGLDRAHIRRYPLLVLSKRPAVPAVSGLDSVWPVISLCAALRGAPDRIEAQPKHGEAVNLRSALWNPRCRHSRRSGRRIPR
jgi:hypothetical protein